MPTSQIQPLLYTLKTYYESDPEGTAFWYKTEQISYCQLWEQIYEFASLLQYRGLKHGARVLLALPNHPEFLFAYFGTQLAGGIPVPVAPQSDASRFLNIAQHCSAKTIVLSTTLPAELFLKKRACLLDSQHQVLTISDSCDSGVTPMTQKSPRRRMESPGYVVSGAMGQKINFPELNPDQTAYLQYTSGSTDLPKGIQVTHNNLKTNISQMVRGLHITQKDIFVCWLPLHHDMGLILMCLVPLFLGAKLILLPSNMVNPKYWLEAVERHRATFIAGPDFIYRLCLLYIKDYEKYDLSSLRVVMNAAEPVRGSTIKKFENAFRLNHVMVPAYGLAEATVGVSTWIPGKEVKLDERGNVSVGRPFPDVDIKILWRNRIAGSNKVGEILVRSPANTKGYFKDSKATSRLFWRDHYIHTGDLGYLDDDGDLFIVGRIKQIIIQAGLNISPRELEELTDQLPFVRYSAAVGLDRGGIEGEQAFIFVEIRSMDIGKRQHFPAMVIDIVEQIKTKMGIRPGRVYLLKPKTIPRTFNGKMQYARLKEDYLNGNLRKGNQILFPDY